MYYVVIDSATGDELGTIEVDDDATDETIIEGLCFTGYLEAGADAYEITDGDTFSEDGERTVRDEEGPVLVLAQEDDSDDDEADNGATDGEDDEPEDL